MLYFLYDLDDDDDDDDNNNNNNNYYYYYSSIVGLPNIWNVSLTFGMVTFNIMVLSWRRCTVVERWSLTGEPLLYLINSWTGDQFVGKLSTVGQPTRPTQPFILPGR